MGFTRIVFLCIPNYMSLLSLGNHLILSVWNTFFKNLFYVLSNKILNTIDRYIFFFLTYVNFVFSNLFIVCFLYRKTYIFHHFEGHLRVLPRERECSEYRHVIMNSNNYKNAIYNVDGGVMNFLGWLIHTPACTHSYKYII